MAAPAASLKAVLVALGGNALVTIIKFIAFALSGSGAMLSEAVHSAADTGNQLLLFLGLKRSGRAQDEDFPYGYGGERFVFGILSAAGIFFVGCGVTVYHGISSLLHPHQPEIGPVTFAVLGVSFLIEGSVLLFAVRGLRQQAGSMGFWRYLREKADPAAVAILLEDGVAVLGLVLATAGILLAYLTGNPVFDSLGSIVVGLLLGLVALYLVLENRGLLLGQSVPEESLQRFLQVVRSRPSIASIHDVKTRQLTPETFVFKAEIRFSETFLAARLAEVLPAGSLGRTGPEHEQKLLEVARFVIRTLSEEVDALEHQVRTVVPEAKHIDLELEHLQAPPQEPQAPQAQVARAVGQGG